MTKQRNLLRARARAMIDNLEKNFPQPAVESERLASQARDLAVKANDRLLEAEALLQLGRTFVPSTNPRLVWELLHHAKSIFAANGVGYKALSCHIALAKILYDTGEERSAITLANKILENVQLRGEDRAFAHILIALCQSNLGELDDALNRLSSIAMPLAQGYPQTSLLTHVNWALGLTYTRMYVSRSDPEILRGLPKRTLAEARLPSPGEILGYFDRAFAAMEDGKRWPYLDIGRNLAKGMMEGLDSTVEALDSIVLGNLEVDPPLAARALFYKGLVLRRLNRPVEALTAFSEAIVRAKNLQSWAVARDLLVNISLLYESMGKSALALSAHKEYCDLRLRGLISRPKDDSVYSGEFNDQKLDWPTDHLRAIEPVFVKMASKFILDNLHNKIAVKDVVEYCGVGRRTLETAFKKAKSITIGQFIKSHKITNASSALLHTNGSVKEVALLFGFSSLEVFSRDFRSVFRCSPLRWRKLQLSSSGLQNRKADD